MASLCGITFVLGIVAVLGHLVWVSVAAVVRAIFSPGPAAAHPDGPAEYCPGCGEDRDPHAVHCPRCHLQFNGKRARDLQRVRTAQDELRALLDRSEIDPEAAGPVLDRLGARARTLRGLPPKRPRAKPIAPAAENELLAAHPAAALPSAAPEPLPVPASEPGVPHPEPSPEPGAESPPEPDTDLSPVLAAVEAEPAAPRPVPAPAPPKPRRGFLEEHNILWGELVGGLLIVGCSIALVVTLRQTLEAIPYFRFLLSAAVTLGLFGAGQYTLHRWKLTGTSRGMLVIALLLTPLTLLLLAPPFTEGTHGAADVAVKALALAAFVGVTRACGRDLVRTEHLPGPVDRRWLLALAVVGAAGTQLLPAQWASAWPPLVCFALACGATLGGLTLYRRAPRGEPVRDASGTALLLFVGVAAFALISAWSLHAVRESALVAERLRSLAVPLALAGVPVIEAGVLVLRRVAPAGLRTAGTAVALTGFVAATTGLALGWPDPLALLAVSGALGAYLTGVAFRERLPWVQAGALGLLAFATLLAFHGTRGSWAHPAALGAHLGSAESGAVLVGFALALALLAAPLARRGSPQAAGYAVGAGVCGARGRGRVSWPGPERPAVAAVAHAAAALGLLAANARLKRAALAHGGVWLVLVGTLWALWWQAPRQPAVWGFVLAAEALALTAGGLALRGAHRGATAPLRRAGRDAAFAAGGLALVLGVASRAPESSWHTGTLLALAVTAFGLARLTGALAFTWVGAALALLGMVHVGVFTWAVKPERFSVEVALLAHATLMTVAAVLCRRQRRVFGDPLRGAARVVSALAVPLLFFPSFGWALPTAGLAVWLGAVWLAFVLLWRERGAFGAFQAALTLASLLAALAWIEQQEWWQTTSLRHRDPRALHAFGLALGALAVAWAVARRAVRGGERTRLLWHDNPLSVDRVALGATVFGCLLLAAVAVVPGAVAELMPLNAARRASAPAELGHAFGPGAWLLLGTLALAVLLSWRASKVAGDVNAHSLGLALLASAAPLVWAGAYGAELATASALRWGLSVVFLAGSVLVALRSPARRAAELMGFPVQPDPWLRASLLALFGTAAAAVVVLSALVAETGLSRLTPAGPHAESVFAQMGTARSNLVPLALVVLGLAATAARDRSSGYGLAGGLVFVATVTAGYALSVVTAGKPLDGTEQTRLWLIFAGAAAVWALAWLVSEKRVPGGTPLAVQVSLGFGAVGVVCFFPGARLLFRPDTVLPESVAPIGTLGWLALALVAGAGFWHARRVYPGAGSAVFAFAGLLSGVLLASAVRTEDGPGRWVSFHALALMWAAVGCGFLATVKRVKLGPVWLACFAALLVLCALRGGWADPWRPWLPAGLALAAAALVGALALGTRAAALAVVSGLAVNLAALFLWVAWGPDTLSSLFLANAAGVAAWLTAWAVVRERRAKFGDGRWLEPLDDGLVPALVLLLLGLAPRLAGEATNPYLAWGALAAAAVACASGLWAQSAPFARPGLFAVGTLAVLLAVAHLDPRPVWDVPATSLALAGYAVAVAALAVLIARRAEPRLRSALGARPWPLGGLPLLAAGAGALGLRIELTALELTHRMASPAAVALLAVAFGVLAVLYRQRARVPLRTTSAALAVLALAALAWAVPSPRGAHVWLHRNAWLFVALVFAAWVGAEGGPRLKSGWRRVVRAVAGRVAVAALAALCLNLLQQVPVYSPDTLRTPLERDTSLSVLAAAAALSALALRFALKPERDPFRLSLRGRTAYVYVAELLLVLFFVQIKLNVPELFLGNLAKLWTFAVMALAYAGIGLAELFERRKVEVLALPLRRTGVLLPLVPLLAFWARPPEFVTDFARGTAPGLSPFLDYLRALPQHFDTYAWLWFLAGGVYGFVALSRRSFGWALLAALATNAAMWALLTHNGVPFFAHPQAWVIPLALIVLVSEHVNRHRLRPDISNGMRYTGVAMIYVASSADMFIAGVGNSMWLPVLLAVLCVSGVLTGMWLRVRAFVYLGVGFLLLDLFAMIWHAAVNLQQTWVWYASGIVLGVVVLALFAYLEKRRAAAKEAESE